MLKKFFGDTPYRQRVVKLSTAIVASLLFQSTNSRGGATFDGSGGPGGIGGFGTIAGGDMGLLGAWWAMFADLLVRGAFFLARFASGRWQRIRV